MTSRHVASVLVAVGLAALVGCGGGETRSGGPLMESPERVRVCIPQPSDDRATLGVDVTENTGSADVVVRSVKLTHPHGMKMLGAKVMFIPKDSTQTLVGFRKGWPPRLDANETEVLRAMDRLPDAVGTVLPGNDPQTIAIVVGVAVKPGGTSGPIEISYEDGRGRAYTWTGPTSFRTDATSCQSDDDE